MKKVLLALLAVVMFSVAVMAEEGGIYFKVGKLELTYPLSNVDVVSLYDVWQGEGLLGAETKLIKFGRLNLNGGAITSFQANGMPYASLDYDWGIMIASMPSINFDLGVWYGFDFNIHDHRFGIKASKKLW